jgi:hypothetical protein
MRSVFDLLAAVKKEPASFLEGAPADRRTQLRNLEALLLGWDVGGPADKHFLGTLARFLHDRYGWDLTDSPVVQISVHSRSDAEAWDSFWEIVGEMREASRRGPGAAEPLEAQAPHEREASGMRSRRS